MPIWPRPPAFSVAGRRVLARAEAEARRLEHDWIGTEHLALALAADEDGEAGPILRGLGLDAAALDAQLSEIVGPGEGASDDPRLTTRTRRVIEHAVEELMRLGDAEIGTGHLLLGLIREPEGIGAHLLARAGVEHDVLRQEVLRSVEPPGAGM